MVNVTSMFAQLGMPRVSTIGLSLSSSMASGVIVYTSHISTAVLLPTFVGFPPHRVLAAHLAEQQTISPTRLATPNLLKSTLSVSQSVGMVGYGIHVGISTGP